MKVEVTEWHRGINVDGYYAHVTANFEHMPLTKMIFADGDTTHAQRYIYGETERKIFVQELLLLMDELMIWADGAEE